MACWPRRRRTNTVTATPIARPVTKLGTAIARAASGVMTAGFWGAVCRRYRWREKLSNSRPTGSGSHLGEMVPSPV